MLSEAMLKDSYPRPYVLEPNTLPSFPSFYSETRKEWASLLPGNRRTEHEEKEGTSVGESIVDFSVWKDSRSETEEDGTPFLDGISLLLSQSEEHEEKERKKRTVQSDSREACPLVKEEEKCYLCMRYILPSAEPVTTLPCSDSCGSKFHFGCLANTLWHFRRDELLCPICTDPKKSALPCETFLSPRALLPSGAGEGGERLFDAYLGNPEETQRGFLRKLEPVILKATLASPDRFGSMEQCASFAVTQVREQVALRASSIYESGYDGDYKGTPSTNTINGEKKLTTANFVNHLMHYMKIGDLLRLGVSLDEVYLFLTSSFRGLLIMGFSLRDIKLLEETDQVRTLVDLYRVECSDLRSVLGTELTIQNLLSFRWNAETFQVLGIDMHQLCILKLQKDNIPAFHFTMEQWLRELHLSKTALKILRIHASDFKAPDGKLFVSGWDLFKLIHQLKISPVEVAELKLNGYSSCYKTKECGILSPVSLTDTAAIESSATKPISYAKVVGTKKISPPAPAFPHIRESEITASQVLYAHEEGKKQDDGSVGKKKNPTPIKSWRRKPYQSRECATRGTPRPYRVPRTEYSDRTTRRDQ